MRFIFIFFILVFFTNCKTKKFDQKEQQPVLSVLNPINEFNPKIWYDKDLNVDQIPGISLNKWYKENKKPKKRSVTVAVIDTQIDTNHEELLNTFWINKGEIPNNNIDDDKNGYIDDINGWNFIGTKKGSTVWANFEFVRIVRDYDKLYNGKKTSNINKTELPYNNEYHRSIKKLEQEKGFYANWLKSLKYNLVKFPIAKDSLKQYFPKEDYSYQQLDSMYKKYKINDKTYMQRRDDDDKDLGALVDFMMAQFEVNQKNLSDIQVKEKEIDSIVSRNLNASYDERTFFDLNPYVLEKGYGNNNISSNLAGRTINNHCTMVSGILASNRANLIGINGISNNIKLMPLSISPSGDEHDKDIAMAIRYAVDNGAKVINMSFGKEFSLHKQWLEEAFKYAEQHNVLLVHSAGNNSFNVDVNPYYPTDISYESSSKEVCGNFISVGATTAKIDSTLVASFSNYGKNNVDLFAPGDRIYTTMAGNSYGYDSGTSLAAPMVSGTAALIWSYYPKLSVQEVKQIILESGTAYDIEVLVPGGEGKKMKFSELSKSGKVLNVYDAMELAKKVSKKKR
ncbi:S8 family peptidase [Flavobacterium glaciei]|uniref:Subtilase family protein n=1 Tax=Flavobacterium glaciei TaxID=386300 RepID=A0A562PQ14_9FLAO|nr:S8 family peptidase [Flavobacterium glaciei]RDI53567.1 subtilase family protein [Flavobacterium glaciei]TWI46468.1 subtilase family protein [Flavobacterium glaciei]